MSVHWATSKTPPMFGRDEIPLPHQRIINNLLDWSKSRGKLLRNVGHRALRASGAEKAGSSEGQMGTDRGYLRRS